MPGKLICTFLILCTLFACKKEEEESAGPPVALGTPGSGVQDLDGNKYSTVVIGNQEWMSENLRSAHYANGDTIYSGINVESVESEQSPSYFFYPDNDSSKNLSSYGRLYTYYAASDPRNVCPSGWRLPSKNDWEVLIEYLGGDENGGGKLKGTAGWNAPNAGADNLSGFNGLPAGFKEVDGAFDQFGRLASWWTSTADTANRIWTYYVKYSYPIVFEGPNEKKRALSVRCIRN
ncbi:MAG: hypothetical protein EP338_05280 [Bacteroidetes bacterium]|nr:MAG: hypothetical protein EP338_05280 [Bacteroidota bacterium]